ncbi:methyltransferase domain-containing protein [Jiangella aurantiaca]|uniref:Methyltransferase domain-containing protein n=1 Tax=Jiangella aurantiaca TaxID=2530373 RepID=A0A4R5AQH3_9ACTN|nr:methyltransferase domain-containing protein [Jiangella aurantiaca]TDD72602.1 methyltransferase domain-containing protein [Jiangella aurantiaca]
MAFDYDAELRHLDPPFRAALGIGRGDRVLDVGCGSGRTTRDAARIAAEGRVLGVDVSPARIDEARDIAEAERLRNVAFEVADAQAHPFPDDEFDLVMSRFGTMFFADPMAAFTNLARATRPGGRLVMMVWRERNVNEWAGAPIEAILGGADAVPGDDSAFSLADRDSTRSLLESAGFGEVEFSGVGAPVWYGADVGAALEAVLQLKAPQDALGRLAGTERPRARERLGARLAAHATPQGVLLDARAWIVAARRHLD